MRAVCFNRRTCVRCPLDNRFGLILLVLSAIGVNSYSVNDRGGCSRSTSCIPVNMSQMAWGHPQVLLDVRWHRVYFSVNCAMIVFKTRADWHMASVSCGFRSIGSTHSTPPWLRATGKLRQTSLMPQ